MVLVQCIDNICNFAGAGPLLNRSQTAPSARLHIRAALVQALRFLCACTQHRFCFYFPFGHSLPARHWSRHHKRERLLPTLPVEPVDNICNPAGASPLANKLRTALSARFRTHAAWVQALWFLCDYKRYRFGFCSLTPSSRNAHHSPMEKMYERLLPTLPVEPVDNICNPAGASPLANKLQTASSARFRTHAAWVQALWFLCDYKRYRFGFCSLTPSSRNAHHSPMEKMYERLLPVLPDEPDDNICIPAGASPLANKLRTALSARFRTHAAWAPAQRFHCGCTRYRFCFCSLTPNSQNVHHSPMARMYERLLQ
jgi:hypothetical protein